MTKTRRERRKSLQIWVLPVGDGDSIVLRLPEGKWGIVDSNFLPGRTVAAALPLLQGLMLPRDERLNFVCISHYHEDHFSGMSQILKCSGLLCSRDGYFFHNGFEWAEAYPPIGWRHAIREVTSMKRIVHSGSCPLADWPVAPDMEVDLSRSVRIRFIAPTPDRKTSLLNALFKNAKKKNLAPKVFNRIGIAFFLKYGDATLLFADDIEGPMWRKIRQNHARVKPCWVKVSHHGARNGNPKGLWEWLAGGAAKKDRPHAVVSADGKHHPSKSVISEIREFAHIHTTYSSERTQTPSSTFDLAFWADAGFPRAGPSIRTWASVVLRQRKVCYFRVLPNGKVLTV